ncbi:MAG: hypothetical protein EBS90_11555 [Betaproteobacteria bacterium]|nr:hypothetical protein [Betaproteobacteria bacterium]
MSAPVRITPEERLMCCSYDHPEQSHVPPCCNGALCIGAAVRHGATMRPFCRPLPSFRTRDTRALVGMPAGLCILCITALQTVPRHGPRPAGSIPQVFCHSPAFGPTPPDKTVQGVGGPYMSNSLEDWTVEQMVVGGHVVHYILDHRLF